MQCFYALLSVIWNVVRYQQNRSPSYILCRSVKNTVSPAMVWLPKYRPKITSYSFSIDSKIHLFLEHRSLKLPKIQYFGLINLPIPKQKYPQFYFSRWKQVCVWTIIIIIKGLDVNSVNYQPNSPHPILVPSGHTQNRTNTPKIGTIISSRNLPKNRSI